ncbi:MAG: hypothetical protein NVSMB65_05220 [Chloroflexota bacterium]
MAAATNCKRTSGLVSTNSVVPLLSTRTEGRVRLSRGSFERQTSQEHPIIGTPWLVPVPRSVTLIAACTRARATPCHGPAAGAFPLYPPR